MFIYDKTRKYMINAEEIKEVFLDREVGVVVAGLRDGTTVKLAVYDSGAESRFAIDMLAEAMAENRREVICMPCPGEERKIRR